MHAWRLDFTTRVAGGWDISSEIIGWNRGAPFQALRDWPSNGGVFISIRYEDTVETYQWIQANSQHTGTALDRLTHTKNSETITQYLSYRHKGIHNWILMVNAPFAVNSILWDRKWGSWDSATMVPKNLRLLSRVEERRAEKSSLVGFLQMTGEIWAQQNEQGREANSRRRDSHWSWSVKRRSYLEATEVNREEIIVIGGQTRSKSISYL